MNIINIKGINTCPPVFGNPLDHNRVRQAGWKWACTYSPRPLQIFWYCAFLSAAAKVNSIVVVNLLNILQTAEVQHRCWTSFLRLSSNECQQTYGINHGQRRTRIIQPRAELFSFLPVRECYSFYLFGWFLCICGKFIYSNCKKKQNCLVWDEMSWRDSRQKFDVLNQ